MRQVYWAVIGIAVVVLGIIISQSLFIVRQTEQAIVVQFGDPKRVVQERGLNFKVPFVQAVEIYDRHILGLDPPPEQVLLIDQKRVIVDAFARYRITDPLRFFQSVRTEQTFDDRFGRILNSAVRAVVAEQDLTSLLSEQRIAIMRRIFTLVESNAPTFGVELTDLRIGRSELPDEVSGNVYERMRTEREREANLLRAEGEETSRRIRAEADRQQVEIVAEARREAEILRGEGDAARNRILGAAYNQDKEFFDFFRSLEAYRDAFNPEDTTMVLSPDSDFFRYFGDVGGGLGPTGPTAE